MSRLVVVLLVALLLLGGLFYLLSSSAEAVPQSTIETDVTANATAG